MLLWKPVIFIELPWQQPVNTAISPRLVFASREGCIPRLSWSKTYPYICANPVISVDPNWVLNSWNWLPSTKRANTYKINKSHKMRSLHTTWNKTSKTTNKLATFSTLLSQKLLHLREAYRSFRHKEFFFFFFFLFVAGGRWSRCEKERN